MVDHSLVAPSSAERWVHCHGSVALASLYPEPDTPGSREGTAAHWVLEQLKNAPAANIQSGDKDPNGTVIDQDMIDAARQTLLQVGEEVGQINLPDVLAETTVQIPRISPYCFGTVDLHYYDPKSKTLYLWDYKYGHAHIPAFENWQLICYFSGLMDLYDLNDLETTVVFRTFQPRCFHGRESDRHWRIPASDVRPYLNQLYNAASLAFSDNAKVSAGIHCTFCPARHACPAARDAALAGFRYAQQPVPQELNDNGLSLEYTLLRRARDLIEARLSGIETQVESRIRAGHHVPGYTTEERQGNRRWSIDDSIQMLEVLEIVTGLDCRESPKPRTVAQVEKLLKENKVDATVITDYIVRPSNGIKIVEDDGSRARFLFSQAPEINHV